MTFPFTVQGNSMNRAGLEHGQVVTVRPTNDVRHNDIVAAELEDGGGVVKRFKQKMAGRQRSNAYLVSESTEDHWRPILVTADVRILGVVVMEARSTVPMAAEAVAVWDDVLDRAERYGAATELGHPPLVVLLLVTRELLSRDCLRRMGAVELERSLGLRPGDVGRILAGHVPQLRDLLKLGRRIEEVTGKGVNPARLREIAASRPTSAPSQP